MTTKVICPKCSRVHLKTETCICEKSEKFEYHDPNPFDR